MIKSFHLSILTNINECPFEFFYPFGPLKEAADKGIVEYYKKCGELYGKPVKNEDNFKEIDENITSYEILKISIYDTEKKPYETDCIIIKYNYQTILQFTYKGIVVNFYDRSNFFESEDFKNLGFIDLLKDNTTK